MDKFYIIFTGTIVRMGGAQLYVSNKAKRMKELGWKVLVFSGLKGPIMINDLLEYDNGIKDEFSIYPFLLSHKTINKIFDNIINNNHISVENEVIIETNSIHSAYWGEIFAQKIRGKHFIFLLDEYYDFPKNYLPFFQFKYKREELALINKKAFDSLFKNNTVEFKEKTILVAPCNNVVSDIKTTLLDDINFDSFDYVCLSLGRLNKNYIPNVIDGFKEFALNNPNKKMLYIFIGNQPEDYPINIYQNIKDELSVLNNVELNMMGYVFPIPKKIFQFIDFAVASSGSSWVLLNEDIPTVTMDANDGKPIGILGFSTMQSLYRNDEKIIELSNYMDDVLIKGILNDHDLEKKDYGTENEMIEDHINFINNSCDKRDYFDMNLIKLNGIKDRIKIWIISLVGIKQYKKIIKYIT